VRGSTSHHPVHPTRTGVRFSNPREYHSRVNRRHIYRSWIQEPVMYSYTDGYWDIDGQPYYVHRGFRYRYSPVEMCQYQLVDGEDYSVVKDYGLKSCSESYDECAVERDVFNSEVGMDRFFCAEAVEGDLQNNTADYSPTPIEVDGGKLAKIAAYLEGKSFHDIFTDGYNGGVGECLIYRLRGNEHGCGYIVTVRDEYFPDIEGNICSASHIAAQVGCNVGDDRVNAGCILQKAVREGHCH